MGCLFMQPESRNSLLCRIKIALLLVIIKKPSHGVQIFRIGRQRRTCLIGEFAQALGLSQQVEVTLDQLRRPQWLESLLVNGQSLLERALAVLNHGLGFYRKNVVVGELLPVVRDKLIRRSVVLLRDKEIEKARIQRALLGITSQPGAVLSGRSLFSQPLVLDDAENAPKSSPGLLFCRPN